MVDLVGLHPFQDSPGLEVLGRHLRQVPREMVFDLTFRFHHEAEAPLVPRQAGGGADRQGTGIPEGIEQAFAVPQLLDAALAPVQVIVFLLGRAGHAGAGLLQARGQGLTLVKALGTDLPGVVDAHQPRHVAPFPLAQFGVGETGGGTGTLRDLGRPEEGAHPLVQAHQKTIQRGVITVVHGG